MRIHPVAVEVAKNVVENIEGRSADQGISLPVIGSTVALAGDGDHLDLGSLFGSSAIVAALVKKELKIGGKVICLDPYIPRDPSISAGNMPPELLDGNPEALMKNAERFGVELTLIQEKSQPWPKKLKDAKFSSALIDGDHIEDTPWLDFQEVSKRCDGYILIDNFEEGYPDVMSAIQKAMESPDWFLHYKNYVCGVFRRKLPPRANGTPLSMM